MSWSAMATLSVGFPIWSWIRLQSMAHQRTVLPVSREMRVLRRLRNWLRYASERVVR